MSGRICHRLPTEFSHRRRPPPASVTKRHYIRGSSRRAESGPGRSSMPAWFRAGLVAALFVFAAAPLSPVQSTEKTFQDAALDDAAIKLEAELKEEAGTGVKPVIALKKDADAALKKGSLDTAAETYVQIVSVAP